MVTEAAEPSSESPIGPTGRWGRPGAVALLLLASVCFGFVVTLWWPAVPIAAGAFGGVNDEATSAIETTDFAVVAPLLVAACYLLARSWTLCARSLERSRGSGDADALTPDAEPDVPRAGVVRILPRGPGRLFGALLLFLGVLTVVVSFVADSEDLALSDVLARCAAGVVLPLAVLVPVLTGRAGGRGRVSPGIFLRNALAVMAALGVQYVIGSVALALVGDRSDEVTVPALVVTWGLQSAVAAGLTIVLIAFASGKRAPA